MMLALLVYSYVTGRFGLRTIEAATYTVVALRYICGGEAYPDHKEVFDETFTKILVLARQMEKLKQAGGAGADGTKIHANVSKHKAVSYKRAGEIIEELKEEVKQLMRMTEEADGKTEKPVINIPDEIKLRKEWKEALEEARAEMEKIIILIKMKINKILKIK